MTRPKRLRTNYGRHRGLVDAAEVRRVRAALELTQAQLAAALGVSRRTVIRGEARGMDIPWRGDSSRAGVRAAWVRLQAKCAK
jgi:DNA-binding XRE family transcriptional regulator